MPDFEQATAVLHAVKEQQAARVTAAQKVAVHALAVELRRLLLPGTAVTESSRSVDVLVRRADGADVCVGFEPTGSPGPYAIRVSYAAPTITRPTSRTWKRYASTPLEALRVSPQTRAYLAGRLARSRGVRPSSFGQK